MSSFKKGDQIRLTVAQEMAADGFDAPAGTRGEVIGRNGRGCSVVYLVQFKPEADWANASDDDWRYWVRPEEIELERDPA